MARPITVPKNSLLDVYKQEQAFTDCYSTIVPISITLPQFIEEFYTTPLFKLERWLLAKVLRIPSSDEQAVLLAKSMTSEFSAWRVENRTNNEILLAAWQTRSWLSISSNVDAGHSSTLYFGSAVIPKEAGDKFGFTFHLFGGVHRLYSKLLLASAAKILVRRYRQTDD